MQDHKKTLPISVIMANYNHGRFLDESLGGIFNQTCLPQEVILIDDSSTDNSLDIIERWKKRYPDVLRVYSNPENQGVLKTIQRGLDLSICNYIYFHSADDYIVPSCYEKYYSQLQQHPQAPFCCSYPSYFTTDPTDYSYIPISWNDVAGYIDPCRLARYINGLWIPGNILLRKEELLSAGGIDQTLDYCADWFWILVMAARKGLCFIPETLTLNRKLPNSFLESGLKSPERMNSMFARLITLLQSDEYDDVLSFFCESSALAVHGSELASFVLGRSEWGSPKLFSLLHRNFYLFNREIDKENGKYSFLRNDRPDLQIHRKFDIGLHEKLPKIVEDLKKKNLNRIAIYGMGTHTQTVLPIWEYLEGPVFECAVISEEAPNIVSNEKLPVRSIKDPIVGNLEAILLSSYDYEKEMYSTVRELYPTIEVYSIWNNFS